MTRFSRWYKEIALPAGLLSSLIVGAGMFALPFVFAQAGFLVGAGYLAAFVFVFANIHRMYASIIEHTPGKHRLVGYARIYLGRTGFIAGVFTTVLGLVFALTAYISLAGEFVGLVIPDGNSGYAPYLFWAAGSLAVLLSFRRLVRLEFAVTLAIGAIVAALFVLGVLRGGVGDLPLVDASQALLPYGVVLFALSGRAAISTLADYYETNRFSREKLRHAISIGTAMPGIVYLLFAAAVYLLSGGVVAPDALSGITHLPPLALSLFAGLGILALFTSYFFLGLEVQGVFQYDLRIPKPVALAAVAFLPVLLFAGGADNFIGLIGIAGGVFLALETVVVIFIYSRIRQWNIFLKGLVFLFVVGALYELWQFV